MPDVKKASCLCGKVKLEILDGAFSFNLCHCHMCQKFGGSAFGAFIGVKRANVKYVSGKDSEKIFDSSDWAARSFCEKCGSSISYIYKEMEDSVFLAAGLFDDDPGSRAKRHIFVKDKCPWFEIGDGIE